MRAGLWGFGGGRLLFTSRTAARIVALGAAVMALVGCVARAGPAEQCSFNTDCADGLVCAGRVCRTQCREDRDCPGAGERCMPSGVRDRTACYRPGEVQNCVYNSDCPAGPTVCLANECRAQCREDRDCPAGTRCREDQVCEAPVVVSTNPDAGDGDGGDASDAPIDAPSDAPADTPTDAPMEGGGATACPDAAVPPVGEREATDVQTSDSVTCALRANGSLWCWGLNSFHSFANSAYPGRYSFAPTPSEFMRRVEHFTLGRNGGCAAVVTGGAPAAPTTEAFCWGQIGPSMSPARVSGLENARLRASSNSACGLLPDGAIRCLGLTESGQLGPNADPRMGTYNAPIAGPSFTGARELGAGVNAYCALHDGGVSCWGWNGYGLLGRPASLMSSPAPVLIDGLWPAGEIGHIYVGPGTGCALHRTSHEVRCWGLNRNEAISSTGAGAVERAVTVEGFDDSASVAVGYAHVCAVSSNGVLRCRGINELGQLGDGTRSRRTGSVTVNLPPVAQAAAYSQTCARLVNGSLQCWGENDDGELGRGFSDAFSTGFRQVDAPANPRAIAPGTGGDGPFLCVLDATDRPQCMGVNTRRQLGRTTGGDGGSFPMEPVGGAPFTATSIRAAGSHVCAIAEDRRVMCWGANERGASGVDLPANNVAAPTAVRGVTNAAQIALGAEHGCALLENGAVRCWGSNELGQLAQPMPMTSSAVSVAVAGLANVRSIAAGSAHTCALLDDGAVRCWGDNYSYQSGVGENRDPVREPHAVTGLGPARELAVGAEHACARMTDDTVRCWGGGRWELGDGGDPSRPVAVAQRVPRLEGVTRLRAGQYFTCAARGATDPVCWGYNDAGELGFDDSRSLATPTAGLVPSALWSNEETCPTCSMRCSIAAGTGAIWCIGWGPNLGTGDDGWYARTRPGPVCAF